MRKLVHASLSPELAEWLDKHAQANGRTRSNQIMQIVREKKEEVERERQEGADGTEKVGRGPEDGAG